MSLLIIPTQLILPFFFFNDTATTEIYTLSLHDALPIFRALSHSLLLQKVNGQNSRVSAVSAAKRERSVLQVGQRGDRTSSDGNDLSHPAEIGVAHGDRAAAMTAPFFGLQVSEVGIPGDIDVRQRITCLREERDDLRLDRKSTRLNSSHSQISYAVFCLKKKNMT